MTVEYTAVPAAFPGQDSKRLCGDRWYRLFRILTCFLGVGRWLLTKQQSRFLWPDREGMKLEEQKQKVNIGEQLYGTTGKFWKWGKVSYRHAACSGKKKWYCQSSSIASHISKPGNLGQQSCFCIITDVREKKAFETLNKSKWCLLSKGGSCIFLKEIQFLLWNLCYTRLIVVLLD